MFWQVEHALRRRAGLRSGGQRSSEYHRQFGWKKPVTAAASPLLTAEQVRSAERVFCGNSEQQHSPSQSGDVSTEQQGAAFSPNHTEAARKTAKLHRHLFYYNNMSLT